MHNEMSTKYHISLQKHFKIFFELETIGYGTNYLFKKFARQKESNRHKKHKF